MPGSPKAPCRARVAATLLVGIAALHVWAAAFWSYDVWATISGSTFAGIYLIAAFALWGQAYWARWFALGAAAGGVLNTAAVAGVLSSDRFAGMSAEVASWVAAEGLAYLSLLALLCGRTMVGAYDRRPSPRNRWDLSRRSVGVLSWALVLNFAAVPILVFAVGADGAWLTPSLRLLAAALAVTLTLAGVLVVKQRTLGVIAFGVAGVGLAIFGLGALGAFVQLASFDPVAMTMTCGSGYQIQALSMLDAALICSSVLPAALSALAASGLFVGPMARFVTRR